ncbi:MAG: protein kinase, partial [Myxococcales bacterium]|nr:protein kinase [Myxococcales bacterium]
MADDSVKPKDRAPSRGEYMIVRASERSDRFERSAVPTAIADEQPTRPLRRAIGRGKPSGPSLDDLERLGTGEFAAALHLAGRYRLERRLGKGGMATVFLGEHLGLDRKVAVKVLGDEHPDRHHAMARFLREARLSARIRHENVVEVFDFGSTPEGVVYLVMELLEGEDL